MEGVVVSDSAGAVEVGEVNSSSVPEGLELTGRSGWSDGTLGSSSVGAAGLVGVDVAGDVTPAMVVVAMSAWLSSSCSVGIGSTIAFSASIDSPHNFRCQSVKVPLCSFTKASLTVMVQVPMPDSPLRSY